MIWFPNKRNSVKPTIPAARSPKNPPPPPAQMASSPSVAIGDLVYLYCDRNKSRGRDRYLITPIDGAWCQVTKFVGSQLRGTTYRFKKGECYKVPMDASPSPCHITWIVPTSTTMTRMIPPCLQPHHHRYLQLLLYRPTEDGLPPPTSPPVPVVLTTPPSHPDTDTNLTSLPSPCNQQGQDVVPKWPARTRRTPQYLEDFLLYQFYPSRPCHYERRRKETGKETVAPLGIISCVTLLYWLVRRAHLGKRTLSLPRLLSSVDVVLFVTFPPFCSDRVLLFLLTLLTGATFSFHIRLPSTLNTGYESSTFWIRTPE